jgi:hypothetical protein
MTAPLLKLLPWITKFFEGFEAIHKATTAGGLISGED